MYILGGFLKTCVLKGKTWKKPDDHRRKTGLVLLKAIFGHYRTNQSMGIEGAKNDPGIYNGDLTRRGEVRGLNQKIV